MQRAVSATLPGRHSGKLVKLHEQFPVSRRWILRESFGWMGLFLAVLAASWLWSPEIFRLHSGSEFGELSLFAQKKSVLMLGAAVVVCIKVIQYELLRRVFLLELEGRRLSVRQGIMLREWASVPLTQFTEVYVRQDLRDWIFGLASVEITLPSRRQGQNGIFIRALSRQSAHSLRHALERLLVRAEPNPNFKVKWRRVNGRLRRASCEQHVL